MARRRKYDQKRQPDYVIKMKPRDRDETGWTVVGVGWQSENGVKLKLRRGVMLDWHDYDSATGDMVLMLFNADDVPRRPRRDDDDDYLEEERQDARARRRRR